MTQSSSKPPLGMNLSPFKRDIDELIGEFVEGDLTTFADMKSVWLSRKFSYIYEASPNSNLAFFMQSLYAHTIGHMVSIDSFSRRLGGLYCLYCLHEIQPFKPKFRVYISLQELGKFRDLVVEAKDKGVEIAAAVAKQMLDKNMFIFGAVNEDSTKKLNQLTELQNARVRFAYDKLISETEIEQFIHLDMGKEVGLISLHKMSLEYAEDKKRAIKGAGEIVEIEDIKHISEEKELVGERVERLKEKWDSQRLSFYVRSPVQKKVKIKKLVTYMGGVLLSKASSDVNFVIVKNVLAAKYKWALNTQKKPIVTLNWLHQCWNEHRVVPQEPYKIPPFSGLTICVTRIPSDERKGMEKVISEYGGRYSAELTKSCTHLIADAAEGDKYKVARKWGHIQIVTRKWFQQSIDRKVCLNEESFRVLSSIPLTRGVRELGIHNGQEKFPSAAPASAADSYASCAQSRDSDIEASASQNVFSTSMNPSTDVEEPSGGPTTRTQEQNIDGCTARDSESEDNDLYLSDCRIFLLGFEASEMRKHVKLVRRGGGSRYMLLNERMTHIVVGTPSESEKREARSVAASGVIQVVTPSWLEDCDREKKEIPVHKIYTAHHLIFPRDSACMTKGSFAGTSSMEQGKNTRGQTMAYDSSSRSINVSNGPATFLGKNKEAMQEFGRKDEIHAGRKIVSPKQKETLISLVTSKSKEQQNIQFEFSGQNKQERKSSVFKGKTFCFSHSFPEDRRPEIVEWVNEGGGEVVNDPLYYQIVQRPEIAEWVNEGGGEVVNDPLIYNAHFTIECHGGFRSAGTTQTIYVSSHWVRSCLKDGCLLDVSSHILYSPLPCQIPLPGFQSLCICSSQYEEKNLLRNLCIVLGAKFVDKLTRKVTHLLCNFAYGLKYERASKWGIVSVTSEWVYECVRQNQVVCPDNFHPKELTTQDREAGSSFASQFHTQFVPMASRDNVSLLVSHSEDKEKTQKFAGKSGCSKGEVKNRLGEIGKEQTFPSKKAKLLRDSQESDVFPVKELPSNCDRPSKSGDGIVSGYDVASGREVPDVADTIEDLLEQTSKIQDQKSPGTISEKTIFSTSEQYNTGNHSVTGLSRHWINRVHKNDNMGSPLGEVTTGTYGNFSETQTESQVVGYEEDLSGRQMLIDRVRTRSSLT